MKHLTPAQELLRTHLQELGVDTIPEYQFTPNRRWRFDLASETYRIGFEVNGHFRGRHGAGWSNDSEKFNTAQMHGWRVLVFTNREVLKGKALEFLREHLP